MFERIFAVKRTLILGTTPLARELVETIKSRPHGRYQIIGVVTESAAAEKSFPCSVLGSLDELERIVNEQHPDCIVVALAERRGRLPVRQLIKERIRARSVIEDGGDFYERVTGKIAVDSLTPSNVIFSSDFKPSPVALAVSRLISVLAAIIGLIMLTPLYWLIATAIRRESPGGALFVQERIGLGGRPFRMLKFRTMRPATESRSEWARDNGDRITRLGRFLRKYRLDELPQFISILRGDMNLVGPRPHPVSNYGLFEVVSRNLPECGEQIPYYSLRALVRPGMTGWAQVRYRYANDLDEEMEKLRYDLYYVKHYSVWLDIRILFETCKIVLIGSGTGEIVQVKPIPAPAPPAPAGEGAGAAQS
jgi:exopolysaccharide biosynthesis polyprenyl glycosylphosphotransferase